MPLQERQVESHVPGWASASALLSSEALLHARRIGGLARTHIELASKDVIAVVQVVQVAAAQRTARVELMPAPVAALRVWAADPECFPDRLW